MLHCSSNEPSVYVGDGWPCNCLSILVPNASNHWLGYCPDGSMLSFHHVHEAAELIGMEDIHYKIVIDDVRKLESGHQCC